MQFRVQSFHHPRELLLSRGQQCIVYLVTPQVVMRRGLPIRQPTYLFCWSSPSRLKPAAVWSALLKRFQVARGEFNSLG